LGWQDNGKQTCTEEDNWTEYKLTIQPEDFFLFGSGFGDQDADMTSVKEKKVLWNGINGQLSEDVVLIPATSVKGALSHRVAYHWNRLNGIFAEKLTTQTERESVVGSKNKAVQILFGYEDQTNRIQQRGNLLFSDIIEDNKAEEKILNHVAIDRFTGGAINGALFSEKATYGKGQTYTMTILAKNEVLESETTIKEALENALLDISKGMLPLGGGVNRGNGIFTGTLTRNGEVIS
jgi:CRISPR/Cas system CSM-associated protein Csm3 (group 7 of RAMP superfamily)